MFPTGTPTSLFQGVITLFHRSLPKFRGAEKEEKKKGGMGDVTSLQRRRDELTRVINGDERVYQQLRPVKISRRSPDENY